jgi:hypothetical protein
MENDEVKLFDDAVLDAAAAREAGDSVGAWKLADALASSIPRETGGRPGTSSDGTGSIPDRLAEYEQLLRNEGIVTPAGGPYTVFSLRDLRDVAIRWSSAKRYPQAAFRTHQEAGSPGSEADVALKALCKYAAGGVKRKPSDLDSAAWVEAIEVVDRLLKRKAKYPVSANALRLAVGRKKNTPEREPENFPVPEPVTVSAMAQQFKSLPPKERAAFTKDVLTSDPEARKDVEDTVREVKNTELAEAHEQFMRDHAGKRKSGLPGGPDDAPRRTFVDQPLASLGLFSETEGYKESLLRIIKIVSDKRDLLDDETFEYLREWSAEVRTNLDTLDALLKLGTGLTDEALEDLLKGD